MENCLSMKRFLPNVVVSDSSALVVFSNLFIVVSYPKVVTNVSRVHVLNYSFPSFHVKFRKKTFPQSFGVSYGEYTVLHSLNLVCTL